MAFQCSSQAQDIEERDVPLTTLYPAQVTPSQAALQCQAFLRPSALLAKRGNMRAEAP